jgi:4-hydroxy-tetrahydrodipicolinate synthase
MSLFGPISAMVTPFDEHGNVNREVTARLAVWLADKGIDGLFIGGTTGEGLLLSLDERKGLTEVVVSAVGSRVRVIVHAGCMTTADTARLAAHAQKAGASAAAVLSPFFYGADRIAMVEHFAAVAKAAPGFPIYLYNIPENAKNKITADIIMEVSKQAPNLAGIKDSSKDMVFLQKLVSMAPEGFSVLVGSDSVLLPGLSVGAVGGVSAASTAFPEVVVEIVKAFREGDLPKARASQQRLNALLDMLKIGPTPAGYKAALTRRGIPVGGVRAPLRNLTPEEQKRFEKAFDEVWKENS